MFTYSFASPEFLLNFLGRGGDGWDRDYNWKSNASKRKQHVFQVIYKTGFTNRCSVNTVLRNHGICPTIRFRIIRLTIIIYGRTEIEYLDACRTARSRIVINFQIYQKPNLPNKTCRHCITKAVFSPKSTVDGNAIVTWHVLSNRHALIGSKSD